MSEVDVVIVGAGPGGYVCAIRAAQLGKRVVLVERRGSAGRSRLGGTCLNVGCIPSKALLDSSERFHQASHGFADHGIEVTPRLDLARMMQRKDGVVSGLTDGIASLMRKHRITVIHGHGTLDGPGRVTVVAEDGTRTVLSAPAIVLAMGSAPVDLPVLPQDGRRILNSDQAIALTAVPKDLLVVGGGVIGLELGSVWARLGSRVRVVEFLPQIVPGFDPDLATQLQRSLTRQGLTFHLETGVTSGGIKGERVQVHTRGKDGQSQTWDADVVLVAVGRRPMSDGLEASGVVLDERRRIQIDGDFRTSIPGVYAIGDLVPGPMLAHKAEDEGVAVAEIIAGEHGHIDRLLIPSVVYTWPELASVGLNETEARRQERKIRVGRFSFAANGRARAMGETEGQVKIITDATTDQVLGAGILGSRASDLIAEITAVMSFGGSAEDIARTCHAHPTFSEAIREAALDANGRVIHS